MPDYIKARLTDIITDATYGVISTEPTKVTTAHVEDNYPDRTYVFPVKLGTTVKVKAPYGYYALGTVVQYSVDESGTYMNVRGTSSKFDEWYPCTEFGPGKVVDFPIDRD